MIRSNIIGTYLCQNKEEMVEPTENKIKETIH